MDWGTLGQTAAQFLIDYFAVVVGAVCGALFAVDRKLDIVGTVTLGLIAGYGGGIIRDMLLHDKGFFFMQNPELILVCIALCALVSAFRKHVTGLQSHLFYVDAFSMALFALAGAGKAWAAGVGIVISIFLGGLTAVGGGAVRDICTGQTPAVFKPSNFYAVSGIAGSAVYVALAALHAPGPVADIACVAVAFLLTVLSARFGWQTKSK